MPVFTSILRGINVSGQRKVPMAQLRSLYEDLGFKNVATYIQSGNVVFEAASSKGLAQQIETAIHTAFGFEVPVIIRTKKEWEQVVTDNPFLKKNPEKDIAKLHVTFLEVAPDKGLWDKLDLARFLPDECRIMEKEVYLHIPDSYGNTKLSNALFEQKLKIKATTRNWKTVLQLGEIMGV